MSLTFADTHNMVAYLNKSDASEGFNQAIDFINGSYIKDALTVNSTIYVTCTKQFWNTVVVKQSNDVTRLQALVDRKKVVITEVVIRDVLRLDDAEGVYLLAVKLVKCWSFNIPEPCIIYGNYPKLSGPEYRAKSPLEHVPWSSRLLRYAKSRPNGKLIHNSVLNGPYVRRMIAEPGDGERSDIRIPEKKAKLFNEWERFTSNEGESIESYYHRFLKLMNDLKRNKNFPEKIASNLKFLNNLQPEWSRYVTIVHQTKDLHTVDYTQLYDFLKYNQKEVDELKAERLSKIQDPFALMANSKNPYASPAPHQDQSPFNQNFLQQPMTNPEDITDPTIAMNMALALMSKAFKLNYSTPTNNNQRISSNPRNRQIAQPGMNMGQDRQMKMIRGNGGNQFRQYAGHNAGNLNGYNQVHNVRNQVAPNPRVQNFGNQNGLIGIQGNEIQNQIGNGNLMAVHAEGNAAGQNGNQIRCYNCRGFGHYARNCTARPRRRDAAYLQTQLLIAQKEEAGIQLQAEVYDLMAAAANLDEIKEQASSSGTQTDSTPVYDSDGYAEEIKQIEANDQAIQTILLGLPEDIYATVDSYETAQEI
nr:hypothetical protein [Tanacetum cinerariifolium]